MIKFTIGNYIQDPRRDSIIGVGIAVGDLHLPLDIPLDQGRHPDLISNQSDKIYTRIDSGTGIQHRNDARWNIYQSEEGGQVLTIEN